MIVDDFKFNVDALEILIGLSLNCEHPQKIEVANNGQ
jgi:hypothetical protein